MTAAALALVLAAAFVHATWNLLAKRVSATTSAPAFVWLYGTLSSLIYTPPALWLLAHRHTTLGSPSASADPVSSRRRACRDLLSLQ